MTRIPSFTQYLEDDRRTASKTGLYPMGYGGIGLYPDADYLTHGADAILYLSQDKRLYSNGDSAPFNIAKLPGGDDHYDNPNNGERPPFDIRQIPGKSVPPKDSPLPGKIVSFKSFVKLVTKPKEISPKSPNLPD